MATPTAIAPTPPRPLLAPAVNRAAVVAAPTVTAAMASKPPSAAPVTLDDRLPLFTHHEVQLNKVENRNALVFSVPTGSSLLLKLMAPPSHSYEEKDFRWLHLLQAVAIVPSRKVDTIAKLAAQALQLIRSPTYKQRLESELRGLLSVLLENNATTLSFAQRALLALRLKDKVAAFVREWVKDPVEGFVLRNDHVIGGMRLDDLVATPVGAGYLRGYRRHDQFCVVMFPWGHGFIHRGKVEKLEQAIDHERKKRRHNEYLALEHQHLFEQVESLLENYPPANTDAENTTAVVTPDGVNLDDYTKLLMELRNEHYDPEELQHDLTLVRRVQALMTKLTKRQRTQSVVEEDEEEESKGNDGDEPQKPQEEKQAADHAQDEDMVVKAETHEHEEKEDQAMAADDDNDEQEEEMEE